MAVMYSKLGGCLGVTAKLGPLASRDLCAGVKGLLERLITHFGLGSSKGEEPCGVLCLQREDLASCKALSQGNTLEKVPACLALSLAEYLTAWGGEELSAWRVPSSGEEGELAWESSLSVGERVLSSWEAWEAWEIPLSAMKRVLCWGSLGNACLGECTLCLWESAIFWGRLGIACLGIACLEDVTLCWWEHVICQRGLEITSTGELTLCWWKSVFFHESLGIACLGKLTLGRSTVFRGRLRGLRGRS